MRSCFKNENNTLSQIIFQKITCVLSGTAMRAVLGRRTQEWVWNLKTNTVTLFSAACAVGKVTAHSQPSDFHLQVGRAIPKLGYSLERWENRKHNTTTLCLRVCVSFSWLQNTYKEYKSYVFLRWISLCNLLMHYISSVLESQKHPSQIYKASSAKLIVLLSPDARDKSPHFWVSYMECTLHVLSGSVC